MIISFTGTKFGMNAKQIVEVEVFLREHFEQFDGVHSSWFVHGDCIGADVEAAILATKIGYNIWVMPSNVENTRAFSRYDRAEYEEKPLIRDRKIVEAGETLLAAPKQNYEMRKSGTWTTIRFAKKIDKPVHIVYPF